MPKGQPSNIIRFPTDDPMWGRFDGWVTRIGKVFRTRRDRLNAFEAYKAGAEDTRTHGRPHSKFPMDEHKDE